MTRKQLEDLGLSKEQVDSVMKINGEDIENAKGAAAGDSTALNTRIAELEKANSDAAAAHEKEIAQLKIGYEVEKALGSAKAKNAKAAKAMLDMDGLKLEKDGSVKGLKEQIDKLVADESTSFLFESKPEAPKFQGFKPGIGDNVKPGENIDVSAMSYDQVVAYMEANPEAQF